MHWLILMTLAPLLYTLVSAAPPNEGLIYKPEIGHFENVIPAEEENFIEGVTRKEDNKESSEAIVTEKQASEAKNNSKSNFSTQQPSQSEESPVTTEKEAQPVEEGVPAKREDAEQIVVQTESESTSQQQTPEQLVTQTSAGQQETVSETPSVSVTPTVLTTTRIPTTKRPKPSKPKPPRASTSKPSANESPVTPVATARPTSATVKPTKPTSTQRYPCRCADGTCSCCTGIVLENFNVPLRSRACANVTYEPDDFAFNFKLAYNNIVLYNRRMSAKNPRPACIPINRYFGIKMCAKLSNVYMSGRNMHACLDFEGFFDDETAFKYSFNCFRIGSQGVAIVRPEDGGGLPPPPDVEEESDEDYDDSARTWKDERRRVTGGRRWKGEVQVVPY